MEFARGRERPGGDPKLLYLRHELRGWKWSGIGHRGPPLRQWNEDPGGICEEEARLLPRCSCPYAGTTRIRFEGFPRPDRLRASGVSAPCRGTPWKRRLSAECAPA